MFEPEGILRNVCCGLFELQGKSGSPPSVSAQLRGAQRAAVCRALVTGLLSSTLGFSISFHEWIALKHGPSV